MSSKSKNKTLVILDLHAILHRAYHALPPFTSPSGEPTGALYGLTTTILRIAKEFKPDYLVAANDLPEPTFRHAAYEKYKAQRPEAEPALISQFARSREIVETFHIPLLEKAGFEADDIVGTIVEKLKKEKNLSIIIASGDLDALQLVDSTRVRVWTLKKGNESFIYDEKAVRERFGFGPELLPDYKGLRGDPSDNIPGVKGIGEKTAEILVQKFGSVEDIVKLAKTKPEKLKAAGIKDRMAGLLRERSEDALFSKTLSTIRRDAPVEFDLKDAEWKQFERGAVEPLFRALGFTSLIARLPSFAGALASPEPTAERGSAGRPESGTQELFAPSEAHDPKIARELAVAAWLLDSRRVGIAPDEAMRIAGASTPEAALGHFRAELAKEGLLEFFEKTELPLIGILDEMHRAGTMIDRDYLGGMSKIYEKKIAELEKKIWELAGTEFTINSPKQLSDILFNQLKLSAKGIRKTGKGALSTNASELEKLKSAHPIVELILQYRELAKLKSTYIDALPALADAEGRVHTTLNQAGTVTGRFSSENPNLQNIPIRTELGREVRKAFVAPIGWTLVAADYSQIELRIAAILSDDPILKEAFLAGRDIHTATAAAMFHVDIKNVTKDMRYAAKTINFGILYGMGVRALAESLGVTQEKAREFYDKYFHDFGRVKEYIEEVKREAAENGYTTTLFGRRRYFPELQTMPEYMHHEYLRMAINAPIQGSAADMIKKAMVRLHPALAKAGLGKKVRMVLQIHDELLFEIEDSAVKEAATLIKQEMEGVYKDDIPLAVEVSAGPNWAELKKIV
ncbi:MAG: hypothetical protein HYT22_00685 [Candidatus Niyogibacteria bacterium]|nr:hypothetical protein [Candidatus Niyogibacteria bacterium]